MMIFKVGDIVTHIPTDRSGPVLEAYESEFLAHFEGDSEPTTCVQSTEWFKLAKSAPTNEEKAEWASLWDDAAD